MAKAFLSESSGANIAIQNAGSCKVSFSAGTIDHTDVALMMPYFNDLVIHEMAGMDIVDMITQVITGPYGSGSYPYGAGIRWDVDMSDTGEYVEDANKLRNSHFIPYILT